MSVILRATPWRDKSEWESIYLKAFSKDVSLREEAVTSMLRWQTMKTCPHGVICTTALLQVLLKDPDENQNASRELNVEDLKLMYSAAIMRVINLVCETGIKTKETMFHLAKKNGIPNWIINIRHEVSHGTMIPSLFTLRNATNFLINWVKGYYWETEKKSSRDFIIAHRRGEVIHDNIISLLNIYKALKHYEIIGIKKVHQIKNEKSLLDICKMAKLRANLILAEYLPWKYQIDNRVDISPEALKILTLVKCLRKVLKLLKDYLQEDFFSYDTCNLVVEVILEDREMKVDVWSQLLDRLNTWGRSIDIINRFSFKSRGLETSMGGIQKEAGNWALLLSKSLLKREKVEEIKENLSRERVGIEWSVGFSTTELGVNDVKELKILKKLLLKKRLNLHKEYGHTKRKRKKDDEESVVYNTLIKLVEKKNVDLKTALRFKVSMKQNPRDIKKCIRIASEEPNIFSVSCVPFLLELLDPPMQDEDKKNLLTLFNIYLDKESSEGTLSQLGNCYDVRDVKDLEKLLMEANEEMSLNPEQQEGDEKVEDETSVVRSPREEPEFSIPSSFNWKIIPFGLMPWDSEGQPIKDYLLKNN